MGSGLYKKIGFDSAAKLQADFPPSSGFFAVSVTKDGKAVGFPFPFSHAVFVNKVGKYFGYNKEDHTFDMDESIDNDGAKELISTAIEQKMVVTFDEEDLPKQLGGTSTDYLPPEQGGTGKKTEGGDKKKKSDSTMSPLLIGALVAGAIYLLTRKKGE